MSREHIEQIMQKLELMDSKFSSRIDQVENGLIQHRTGALQKWEEDRVFLTEVAEFMKKTKDTLDCVRVKLDQMKPWMNAEETLGALRGFAVWIAPLTFFGVIFGAMWIAVKKLFI
jgi:hypothetical protein